MTIARSTRIASRRFRLGGALLTLALATASALAQDVLPRPAEPFAGKIGTTYADSTAAFPAPVTAPAGAPNVVLVLTDDVGFGAASTFGGAIPTPHLDQLADEGLRFNRFHTTAMCSPTRAALLTGRNHHAVGNGIVANLTTGFPGYNNLMPKSAATIAEVLRQHGYNTAMFGKHHNAPEAHVSAAGPFDMWPTGLGFEYFFGFMAAETNQFTPALYRGITPVPTLEEGVLDKALADDAIHWLHQQQAAAPGKPFFMYYATGTAHAPLQAPADWIARFKGKFAGGYDRMREEVVERQKRMGLVPADTVNTPRPEEIAAWDALTPEQKKINERFMEVYAAMLAYQDEQVGRLFAEIGRMGLRDNTLVIFIEGDNGAAAEGGMHGSMNPMSNFANGTQESEATLLANLERIGGPEAVAQYGYGWTWATNAPFRLAKQYASHLGGTRNGMVVSWPQRITARGIRTQFSHVTDIAPTIYEAAGVTAPDTVNGVKQQPMDGSSLLYAFDKADAAERHDTQYFEMMGNQAIYHQGWLASTTPAIAPWARDRRNDTLPSEYPWELYDLRADFSQAHDLASAHPEKLAQMKALFMEEARRNQVLPLDNRLSMERFLAASSQHRKADRYTYWGAGVSVPAVSAAPILNRSFTISAELDAPAPAQGVVLALGSRFGGWSFFVQDGTPVAVMAASQLEGDQSRVVASGRLPAGKSVLSYQFVSDGGVNAGGEMRISVDGREIGRGRIARTISKLPEMTDTLDIGFDADTPVTAEYRDGGRFNGTLSRVDVRIDR
ncbi:MAG: arylsulfatase [Gammaproteobacteria bacterium]|nr:arylsulfatase [Gammaproteobacteria bacterium]